ncbi:hypothetical protein GW17_00001416 [Ensete ventricosum]|uniref:Uncharacterized protein n=1 Tax=Ensete ventricosum TaxID=4639 RepID=A0A426YJY9_ENSVE|nr:hypothetical protein B296_00013704 [Ensete ventricosum]RWW33841.1 hypothetical protein GW17_00001416 [Ensete ventricosum]
MPKDTELYRHTIPYRPNLDTSVRTGFRDGSHCSILDKLTPEKYDVLKGQIINARITTPDILKVMISP